MDKELKEFHLKMAKSCFNKTWDYIDMEERSDEDTLNMIHTAHASRYHWGQVGEPLHFERGEWQLSKVYYIAGNASQAMYHGQHCLRICEANDIRDFDIAFAYEAIANAYKLLCDDENKDKYKKLAFDVLPEIKDKGDRDYTESELNKI